LSNVVSFSPWLHWDQRSASPERDGPGVYLLGRFEEGAPAIVDPADERVLLIAETRDQSLADRWYQFHRCAFEGADGHSGGRTFRRLFTNGPDSAVPGWLYVAAAGVPAKEDAGRFTKDVTKRLLTEYEERCGRVSGERKRPASSSRHFDRRDANARICWAIEPNWQVY